MTLRYQTHIGAQVAKLIPALAALRISVFRDWPYLYDGDLGYEENYLRDYARTSESIVVTAHADGQIVGAATGMPLEHHADSFGDALKGHSLAETDIFYCAESVLRAGYRGQGAGHAFFEAREGFARQIGRRWSMFCGVVRPKDHPARPDAFRPLDPFWRKKGYAPLQGAVARFTWRDLGDKAETEKPLQVWIKDVSTTGGRDVDQA